MSYEKIIQLLSSYIAKELNLNDKEKDRIRFGLEILVSTIMSLLASLILAKLLGIFDTVLLILFTSAVLKIVSGGIHLKTPWECSLFGAFFFNILGLISIWFKNSIYDNWLSFLVVSSIYILISLFLWSPADVEEKPIEGIRKRKILKLISLLLSSFILILIAISFYVYKERFTLVNVSIILGLLFQSFTVSPAAYKIRDLYYKLKNSYT